MQGLLSEQGRLAGFKPLPDDVTQRFESREMWGAMAAAERFAMRHGFSLGPVAKGSPRGLKRGIQFIPHWTQLDARDRAALDGAIIAHSTEFGPVVVRIRRRSADITLLEAS